MHSAIKSQVKHLLSSVAVPVLLAGLMTMLAAATLLGAGPTGAQTPPPDLTATLFGSIPSTTSIPTFTSVPIRAQLPGCWSVDTNATSDTNFSGLQAIDGTSNNVWAVGFQPDREVTQAFTTHWDGTKWSRVPAPTIQNGSALGGVSILSKDDVWAVGRQGSILSPSMRLLILHWDGRSWTEIAAPHVSGRITMLEDVAAVSADDVWAVGYFEPFMGASGGKQAIILHWDGLAWSQVTTPAITPKEAGSSYSTLESLAVLSKNDIWAVGAGPDGFQPLALHWNGSQWSRASMPAVSGLLHGVTAIAPDDIWAVGNRYPDNRGVDTLTMHWDGTTWSVVQSPGNTGEERVTYWLESVAALAEDEVWAVGYVTLPRSSMPMMLILCWDGRAWNSVDKPTWTEGRYESRLTSVANVGGSIWMAGVHQTGVLLKYNATPCASLTPTPIVPLNPPVPVPGNGTRLFPETGKTMTGLFLDYWNTHGGLPQQGYPISDVIGEVSDLNQGLYTMQYTERAVFEYHPDKAKPYDVLLSQLGTFQYRKNYPDGAPDQKPNNDPGSIFFRETGKRVGGSFLEYWRANGGLMQQGYPISDEFVEVSPLDRKPYTVQYFERAVFEYHPENAKPYDVLLSHLGRFRWDEKYGTSTRLLKTLDSHPILAGHYLIWANSTGPIMGYDIDTGREFRITGMECYKYIVSDGRYVAWTKYCGARHIESMWAYDIQTGREFELRTRSTTLEDDFFVTALVDGVLYYRYYANNARERVGLYARNLSTGEERKVSDSPDLPITIFENGIVLWTEEKLPVGTPPPMHTALPGTPDPTPPPPSREGGEWQLYARKLDGSMAKTLLATSKGRFSSYTSQGEYIVWSAGHLDPDRNIHAYNIRTGEQKVIPAGYAVGLVIRDNLLAWTEGLTPDPRNIGQVAGGSILAHDLNTGKSWTVVEDNTRNTFTIGLTDRKQLVYSVLKPGTIERNIYLRSLEQGR